MITDGKVAELYWDNLNLAAFQAVPWPRADGVPFVTVDAEWNLQLGGIDVADGSVIGYYEGDESSGRWWVIP